METTVPADGASLHVTVEGDGADGPLCLVPTAIGAAPYRRQLAGPFAARFKLAIVELRGSGRSTGAPAELTFDLLARDLEAVRRALGDARAVVLGHSILGVLALEYARRCPASVSHVIAVGTPPRADMAALLARAATFFEEDASDERKQLLRANMAALPPGATPGANMLAQTPMRFSDPRFDAAPLFAGADTRPLFMAHLLGTLTRGWDVTADAASLKTPLLIAHGRHDYTVPYLLWDGIPARLPDAAFHLFARSGHQPFVEEPEAFAEVVTAWMAARPARLSAE